MFLDLASEWAPDSSTLGAGVLLEARNVFCGASTYIPMPGLASVGSTALPSGCKGLFYARSATTGAWSVWAGTTTKLYKLVGSTWTDYSRSSGGNYAVPSGHYWSAAQFGSLLILVNAGDDPQVIDIDSGASNFAALGGSPPRARYVAVVGDFVVLAGLTSNLRKWRNSGVNSAVSWTVGTNLCDEQEIPDGGPITGFHGGEYGNILQDENMFRQLIFQSGQDIAFRMEKRDGIPGSVAPYGSVMRNGMIFYLAEHGFQAFLGQSANPIGDKRVDKWFRENSDRARLEQMLAFYDPSGTRICWAFYGSASSTSFDRLLILDTSVNRWTFAHVSAQFWAVVAQAAKTLEDLDAISSSLDALPLSLDASAWLGNRPTIGAVSTTGTLASLSGPSLTAVLMSSKVELNPGARAVSETYEAKGTFRDATLTLRVNRVEHEDATDRWTSSVTRSARTRRFYKKASGRVHQFELTIVSGSAPWQHLRGLEVTAQADGDL